MIPSTTHHARRALLVAVMVAAAACTGTPDQVAQQALDTSGPAVLQGGAPGEAPQPLTADQVAALPTAGPYTDADIAFIRDMLHHHAQALEMTGLVSERAGNGRVRLIAERMDISQEAETEQMIAWLVERGLEVPELDGTAHAMPGMLTNDQMQELRDATGQEFDLLFLRSMTYHHEGALAMVESLYAREDGSGQEQSIYQIASHVDVDQRLEMDRMADLHAEVVGDA